MNFIGGTYFEQRSDANTGTKTILEGLDDIEARITFEADFDQDLIGTCIGEADDDDIVFNVVHIVQQIVYGRRIECGALEFNHIVLTPYKRTEAEGISSTTALFGVSASHVARTETEQRHTFHALCGDDHLAHFTIGNRKIVLADHLHNDEFRMAMSAHSIFALREGSAHFGA
jgi:hypothetical protein